MTDYKTEACILILDHIEVASLWCQNRTAMASQSDTDFDLFGQYWRTDEFGLSAFTALDDKNTDCGRSENSPPELFEQQAQSSQFKIVAPASLTGVRDIDPNLLTIDPTSVDQPSGTIPAANHQIFNPEQQISLPRSHNMPTEALQDVPLLPDPLGLEQSTLFQPFEDEGFWDNFLDPKVGDEKAGVPRSTVEDRIFFSSLDKTTGAINDIFGDVSTLVAADKSIENAGLHQTNRVNSRKSFATDDERWQGTLKRSKAADHSFLYGVKSTNVFCRPSCPARRAGRQQVEFFPFPTAIEDARNAGYRACKRCIPDTLDNVDKGVNGVCKVLRLMVQDAFEAKVDRGRGFKLEDLAKEADLSPFHFQRVFKANTRMTPGDFATACQSLALQDALARTSLESDFMMMSTDSDLSSTLDSRVNEILKLYSRWNIRTAKKALGGIPPLNYALGAPGLDVLYAEAESPVGQVSIAYTGTKAIHAVTMSNDGGPNLWSRFSPVRQNKETNRIIQQGVDIIQMEAADRDHALPKELIQTLWRARIWLHLVREVNMPCNP